MMYAQVTKLSDRYSVEIYPDDLNLEIINFDDLHTNLYELGYIAKDELEIDDNIWQIILDDREVKEKTTYGYGLKLTHNKVYEVVAVKESGQAKDKTFYPVPDSALAKKSKQIGNVIAYQKNDYYLLWSTNKQTLDVARKRIIEWRRNHQFHLERFL